MKCTAALAGVLALAMLLTGCKKPVDTTAATEKETTRTPRNGRNRYHTKPGGGAASLGDGGHGAAQDRGCRAQLYR